MRPAAEVEAALAWLAARPEIESLRVAVCDLNGVLRGKRIRAVDARKALEGGVRLPPSILACDIWGQDLAEGLHVEETGDSDGVCEPTGRAFLPIDWTPAPTALLPVWMAREDGTPFPSDPRRALAAVLERYRRAELTPVVAMELEFYLIDPASPRPSPPLCPATGRRRETDHVLSVDELDAFEAFLRDACAAAEAQGVATDAAISENGAGQFEINLRHGPDPLRAADDAVFFRRVVRGVARRHGFAATFMAKPYGDRAGSSLHVHFSLCDAAGQNVFDDGTDAGAPVMRHAVAGLIEAMSEEMLLFAPNYNSYRRLRQGTLAPRHATWGYENRTTAIRIPGGASAARRIEHRVAGADANPYLVLAAILAAALDGIEAGLEPEDPIEGFASDRRLRPFPPDWEAAIGAFEGGAQAARHFSPVLRADYVAFKRYELSAFTREISDFELRTYLDAV